MAGIGGLMGVFFPSGTVTRHPEGSAKQSDLKALLLLPSTVSRGLRWPGRDLSGGRSLAQSVPKKKEEGERTRRLGGGQTCPLCAH